MKFEKKWYGILVFIGSILWIVTGILLSLREPGDGHGKYRKTYDLLLYLGIGMMLIIVCLAHHLWQFRSSYRNLKLIAFLDIFGGLTFVAGTIIVAVNPGPFPYVLFSGFLLTTLGLILTAVTGRQKRVFSATISITILAMAGILLFFNDQYTPWMASVLGIIALWLSYLFFFKQHHFSAKSLSDRS